MVHEHLCVDSDWLAGDIKFTRLTGATTSHADQQAVLQVQHYMCYGCNKSKYAAYVQALQHQHDNQKAMQRC